MSTLVKKLSEPIDDIELRGLGTIRVIWNNGVDTTNDERGVRINSCGGEYKVLRGSADVTVIGSDVVIKPLENNTIVEVPNKYNVTYISSNSQYFTGTFDLSDMRGVSGETYTNTALYLKGYGNTGNLENLAQFTGITKLHFNNLDTVNYGSSTVYGNIAKLHTLVNLTNLTINGNPNVTGNLKDLFAQMCINRMSGELSVYANQTVAFNIGSGSYNNVKCTFNSTGCVVTNLSTLTDVGTYNKSTDTWSL